MEVVKNKKKKDSIIDIQTALARYREMNANVRGITRYVTQYDLKDSLKLVEAIGQARNPRFAIDDYNRFTYENFIKWVHCDRTMKSIHPVTKEIITGDPMRGIYIAGNTGSGKSWCMDVMREYVSLFNFRILFGKDKSTSRLYWQSIRSDEIVARFIETSSIYDFKNCRMLCIQDFGSESLEAVSMGNRMNVLRNLIEYRGDRRDCLTMITSNIPIDHEMMRNAYDDRVSSRLMEMCNYFEIKGIDRRKL